MNQLLKLLAVIGLLFGLSAVKAEARYVPHAQPVVDNVYAIIGPLDQRSEQNDGLNNNLGFIVADGGVILIDSGATRLGAEAIARAVGEVTDRPVRWVINTGSQDHRWLGNAYFASQGAEIIALERTAKTQERYAEQHMENIARFVGARSEGSRALPATTRLDGDDVALSRGGVELVLHYTDTHFPGDAWIWLPRQSVLFSGDLIYVERVFAILPWSSARNGQKAFHAMAALAPRYIVPGHGGVCDLATARRDSGDYYDFLVDVIGAAAQEMEPMDEVLDRYQTQPAFAHLEHFDSLHRTNMNRVYLEFESF